MTTGWIKPYLSEHPKTLECQLVILCRGGSPDVSILIESAQGRAADATNGIAAALHAGQPVLQLRHVNNSVRPMLPEQLLGADFDQPFVIARRVFLVGAISHSAARHDVRARTAGDRHVSAGISDDREETLA